MIPIAICDDELLHARQTQAAIRRCEAQAVTRCFETPLALLAAVTQQGYAPRVAVLDIRMAGMDGIELAKRLNALVPGCAVIFLTAYLSYAPDVYETRHVYFVLKRELDRRIGSALRAALAETAAPASLQLATAHGYRNVPVTDVLFLERILRKTRVVLTDGEELVTAAPAASDGVEETHDPYAHIRRVPAAGASASRPFDRCSADVLATTVRSAFSFHTSFFRSALQELYSFVGVQPERDVGASVAADE